MWNVWAPVSWPWTLLQVTIGRTSGLVYRALILHDCLSGFVRVLLTCLRALVLCLLVSVVAPAADQGDRMFQAGLRAERAGDNLRAYALYSRAVALAPGNAAFLER